MTQLSCTFRPRRKRKSSSGSTVKHVFELQTLALRTGKTYVHEPPALVCDQPEIFLDFEGIPDRDIHYLLDALVHQRGDVGYHAFWADADAHGTYAETEELCRAHLLSSRFIQADETKIIIQGRD